MSITTQQSLCFGCLLAVLLSFSIEVNATQSQKELKNVQSRIELQIKALEKQHKEKAYLIQNLEIVEKNQAKLATNSLFLESKIKNNNQSIKVLNTKRNSLLKQKKLIESQINNILVSIYRLSRESQVKLFLNQENPKKISRTLLFTKYIEASHNTLLTSHRETIKKIDNISQTMRTEREKNTRQLTQLDQEKKAISTNLLERKKLLTLLNKQITTNQQKLNTLRANQRRLQSLIKAVERSIADITVPADISPFSTMQRKLIKPTKGKLDKRFGHSIENTQVKWQGVAFISALGKSVQAVHYGRVVFSGWFRGKGLLIIIDHGEGYMTLYAHNQTLHAETGDWVKQSDIIATVGNSGGLDHSELYFEIRHNGEAVNPNKWFK